MKIHLIYMSIIAAVLSYSAFGQPTSQRTGEAIEKLPPRELNPATKTQLKILSLDKRLGTVEATLTNLETAVQALNSVIKIYPQIGRVEVKADQQLVLISGDGLYLNSARIAQLRANDIELLARGRIELTAETSLAEGNGHLLLGAYDGEAAGRARLDANKVLIGGKNDHKIYD